MFSKHLTRTPPQIDMDRILAAPILRGRNVPKLRARSHEAVNELAAAIIKESNVNDPFYMFDLAAVVELWNTWQRLLPWVKPFYAVKCNPEPAMLAALVALGAGFDCASRAEIEAVLAAGVPRDRIIYANPCKDESHLRYAAHVGVNLTTFDSAYEVQKIKKVHPRCSLVLRIRVPNDGKAAARCPLGSKYGALQEEIVPLLEEAKRAGIAVIGVSFHVGSAAACAAVYAAGVKAAKTVFDAAARLGLPKLQFVNVGGGFSSGRQFGDAASTLRSALTAHFPDEAAVSVIAEPGRYFAESAFWLVVNIIGKRSRGDNREYWINDGIYGSMNCLLYDHAVIGTVVPLRRCGTGSRKYRSTVFGPTCDALDTVLTDHWLPEMDVGDWLVFPSMGAYTAAAGSNFNGFSTSSIKTYLCRSS